MKFHKKHRWIAAVIGCALLTIGATVVYWPRVEAAPLVESVQQAKPVFPSRPPADFDNATLLTATQPVADSALDPALLPTQTTEKPPTAFSEDRPISFMPEKLSLAQHGQWQNGWDEPVTESEDGLLAKLPDWSTAAEWLRPASPIAETADVLPEQPQQHVAPQLTTEKIPDESTYIVLTGDTLWTISQKSYGTGALFVALAEHNRTHVRNLQALEVGETVRVPPADWLVSRFPKLCPQPKLKPAHTPMPTADAVRRPEYTVRLGDTLEKIAIIRLGRADRWREILALNHDVVGSSGGYLKPGLILALPEDARSAATVLRPADAIR